MRLHELHCHYCKMYLADVPAGSATFCPNCNKWSEISRPEEDKRGRVKSKKAKPGRGMPPEK